MNSEWEQLTGASDAGLREKVVSREVLYPGYIVSLEHWTVELPDGTRGMREIAALRGASAVVALDEQDRIILVRQHRVAVNRVTFELPAGKLDTAAEDPFLCAQRELSEETGLSAADWQKLTVLEPTPGFCSERIHLYLARSLTEGQCHPDEGELVDVIRIPLALAMEKVMDGTLRDGKTIVGVLMAAKLRGLR